MKSDRDLLHARQHAIVRAAEIVCGHGEHASVESRLRAIANKLGVSTIEPAASNAVGFLERKENGTFGVYYSASLSQKRRNFTVAHELAHIIVDTYCPHIDSNKQVERENFRKSDLERAVDRVAAELIMPEPLMVRILEKQCSLEIGRCSAVDKYRVISALSHCLGVSETAMALRLLELSGIIAALLRFNIRQSGLSLLSYQVSASPIATIKNLKDVKARADEERSGIGIHNVKVECEGITRNLKCNGWNRRMRHGAFKHDEYWVIGWAWRVCPRPVCDDSQ